MGAVTAKVRDKIIVIDDDPTGSQTVHSCLLLTAWDVETLRHALSDPAPLFFILTNTRGMNADDAARLTRSVCRNLQTALDKLKSAGLNIRPIFVSRSDSTLRGHYPVETDVMAEELGPFDAHFLVPAFFEGGRITRNGHHYLLIDGVPVAAHETEFARDAVFGYRHSYLPDYVEEKTAGRITAAAVIHFSLADIRKDCTARLRDLRGNACCVVDAVQQSDLDSFCESVRAAVKDGKRFLFRSAASLLTSLAHLPPQPLPPEAMSAYALGATGVIIVGSHVRKTTEQLTILLQEPTTIGVEVDVDRCVGPKAKDLLGALLRQIADAYALEKTAVVFTSRSERTCADTRERLRFGMAVSTFLMQIVQGLPHDIGFLISKGGITSNDVLSTGLGLKTCQVLGQILPGCSVIRCPEDHPRHPRMPVVIFPGNVGDAAALATVYRRLSGK